MIIRVATPADAPEMLAIYAPFVESSHYSFEWVVPSAEEYRGRVEKTLTRRPWIVAEVDGKVAGFAHTHPFRERISYQWSCESSIYVHADYRGQGIARKLYEKLFELLKLQGIVNVYANIAIPNPVSVAFHEAMGFRAQGLFENAGYKLGKWHSLGWWYLPLQEAKADPAPAKTFAELNIKAGAPL